MSSKGCQGLTARKNIHLALSSQLPQQILDINRKRIPVKTRDFGIGRHTPEVVPVCLCGCTVLVSRGFPLVKPSGSRKLYPIKLMAN